jgi:hypothetical protein
LRVKKRTDVPFDQTYEDAESQSTAAGETVASVYSFNEVGYTKTSITPWHRDDIPGFHVLDTKNFSDHNYFVGDSGDGLSNKKTTSRPALNQARSWES